MKINIEICECIIIFGYTSVLLDSHRSFCNRNSGNLGAKSASAVLLELERHHSLLWFVIGFWLVVPVVSSSQESRTNRVDSWRTWNKGSKVSKKTKAKGHGTVPKVHGIKPPKLRPEQRDWWKLARREIVQCRIEIIRTSPCLVGELWRTLSR